MSHPIHYGMSSPRLPRSLSRPRADLAHRIMYTLDGVSIDTRIYSERLTNYFIVLSQEWDRLLQSELHQACATSSQLQSHRWLPSSRRRLSSTLRVRWPRIKVPYLLLRVVVAARRRGRACFHLRAPTTGAATTKIDLESGQKSLAIA